MAITGENGHSMATTELRKLGRKQLLEILIQQKMENEELKKKLAAAEDALAQRRMIISEAGSIAEATVRINQLMETAQKTADEYLINVKQYCEEQKKKIREACGVEPMEADLEGEEDRKAADGQMQETDEPD